MSKLDKMKYLKSTKARSEHFCSKCANKINIGDIYYSEKLDDKFLHSLHIKKFCLDCYPKFKEELA